MLADAGELTGECAMFIESKNLKYVHPRSGLRELSFALNSKFNFKK